MRQFKPENLPKPRNPSEFLLPSGPLDLEIGAGTGMFALTYAQAHPDRHLIAIEHTNEKFRKFQRQIAEQGPFRNLTAIQANGISWVTQQLPAQSVERLYLLYPNPNPKPKHQNKRWHAMPFMAKLIEVLKPGGEILLVTNEKFYFDEAREFFGQTWKLIEREALIFDQGSSPPEAPRTLFEKKYLERGELCYQLGVMKPG